jgi:pSer/pThr/pTyr-binding forkhead associated (FHA) protein
VARDLGTTIRLIVQVPPRHQYSPTELQEQIEAERRGNPFLVYRQNGAQVIFELVPGTNRVSIGRDPELDLPLAGDEEISGLHAELERVGDTWTVLDDGLSTNGSFVNGAKVNGRRRLVDLDQLRFGRTEVLFKSPGPRTIDKTRTSGETAEIAALSDLQRRVLVALCRPLGTGAAGGAPATNQQIADEVFLSVGAVKAHLRALFEKFAVEEMPQNQKRMLLAARAMDSGAVLPRDLA